MLHTVTFRALAFAMCGGLLVCGASALPMPLQDTAPAAVAPAQEAQGMQAVQRELQSLRELTRQNAAAVAELRAQVETARNERGAAALLAAVLAAVLAALLAVAGWHWYRARRVDRVGRWFEAHGRALAMPPAAAANVPVDVVVDGAAPAEESSLAAPTQPGPVLPEAGPFIPSVAAWAPSSQLDFQTSPGGTLRTVGVEELLDVHDKADFFVSIRETDQAVAVLEAHVHDQADTSALAWMDLLELYHSLGRRKDFEQLRDEFRQRFAAQVPDFERFDQPAPTLEDYGRAISRIVALWPERRVLEVIEESIFRKPGLPGEEPFSLEAYRELVLLHHIATDVAPPKVGPAKPPRATTFSETSLQPLHALDAAERTSAGADVNLLLVPPASPNVGVDIDITMADDEPEMLPVLDFDLDLDSTEGELPEIGRGRL